MGPAVFVAADNFLVEQVVRDAGRLGFEVTTNPRDSGFRSGAKILVINVHKLFNGKSVFGVGAEGKKIDIGAVVVDDAHACLTAIGEQFRVTLPNSHPAYQWALKRFEEPLKQQSFATYLSVSHSDPQYSLEVPFWAVQEHSQELLNVLHANKDDDHLLFHYDFLKDLLPLCRIVIGGTAMELAPAFPPTDLVNSFRTAKRRVYMTATLSDDSVIVTHFGASPAELKDTITAASSQAMGERMILMPQELNPDFSLEDLRDLLSDIALTENVVAIVPSDKAAGKWKDIAHQVLIGDKVSAGVQRLRTEHVGLTLLINRYDGIDLPQDACRVLAIVDLPEVQSLVDRSDLPVLGESKLGLRRQIQRIEQGMGRGVRSTDDYCAVILYGARLTERLLSREGTAMLTPATSAQLELSKMLAKQMEGADVGDLRAVIGKCLGRDKGWIAAGKKALLRAPKKDGLSLEPVQLAGRRAFDEARYGDHKGAAAIIQDAMNKAEDPDLEAWLKVRLAELTNFFDRASAQKILQSAYRLNRSVLRALEGVAYEKLSASKAAQAIAVQNFFRTRFMDTPERLLFVKGLIEDLVFEPDTAEKFEEAVRLVGEMIGIKSQRPEAQLGKGPDNLWLLRDGTFLVIECKNGSLSQTGISKTELGQLEQAVTWFGNNYGGDHNVIPVSVHPLSSLGDKAEPLPKMRVMDKDCLDKLKKALYGFAKEISPPAVLEDEERVRSALNSFRLSEALFLQTYTTSAK